MADKKISELNNASLPLAGTEIVPIVQGGETKKVPISEFGSNQNLQQVTDLGNTTTNTIEVLGLTTPEVKLTEGLNYVDLKADNLTTDRELFAPDENGTIATKEWTNANKQDTLVSGTNIKTINGTTILGSGDLPIESANDLYRSWQYVASSLEGSGLLFSGITAINRYGELGTRSFVAPTGTTRLLSLYFQNYLSATTAGANAGLKMINQADGYIRQGFDTHFVFANNDTNTSNQTVVGSYGSLSASVANLNIADFTVDFFGVGNDVGDTNLSFYCKRISATGQTASYVKVATNSSFPAHTTTDAYLLRMEAPQTEVDANRFIKMTLTNLITGATISHTFPYTESPVLDRSVITCCVRSNRNTGVATNMRFGKLHLTRKAY